MYPEDVHLVEKYLCVFSVTDLSGHDKTDLAMGTACRQRIWRLPCNNCNETNLSFLPQLEHT